MPVSKDRTGPTAYEEDLYHQRSAFLSKQLQVIKRLSLIDGNGEGLASKTGRTLPPIHSLICAQGRH